jgi:hypothetical protein
LLRLFDTRAVPHLKETAGRSESNTTPTVDYAIDVCMEARSSPPSARLLNIAIDRVTYLGEPRVVTRQNRMGRKNISSDEHGMNAAANARFRDVRED